MTGGKSTRSFKGVYSEEMGTTVLVASSRVDGHVFQENLTPKPSRRHDRSVGVSVW